MSKAFWFIGAAFLFLAACESNVPHIQEGAAGGRCGDGDKCDAGLQCISGFCVSIDKGKLGAECEKHTDCDTGLHCQDGFCAADEKEIACNAEIEAPANGTLDPTAKVTVTYDRETSTWTAADDCPWTCNDGYTKSSDETSCITAKQVDCAHNPDAPENSVDIIVSVTIESSDGGATWTDPALCDWECDDDFALEQGACVNSKDVWCDDTQVAIPTNAKIVKVKVTITYTTEDGWSDPADCTWECVDGYDNTGEGCATHTMIKVVPYMPNQVTGHTVDLYKLDGTFVAQYAANDVGDVDIALLPGTYVATVTGGDFLSVLENKKIASPIVMRGRFTVTEGEAQSVVITPLTTLREKLYDAYILKGKTVSEATALSLQLISEHFDQDFNIYLAPAKSAVFSEESKHWVILEIFEYMGQFLQYKYSLDTVSYADIMDAFTNDIKDALMDGNSKTMMLDTFKIDSLFFRYQFAVGMKHFLSSQYNTTALTVDMFQTVISTIANDTSVLFPAAEAPKVVVNTPPVISDKLFKRGVDSIFQAYSAANYIYVDGSVALKFKVDVDENDAIASVVVSGDMNTPAVTLGGGYYQTTIDFSGDDGQKNILITVLTDAGNTGTATLIGYKDTVAPIVTIDDISGFRRFSPSVDYEITEDYLDAISYRVTFGADVVDDVALTAKSGTFAPAATQDGSYSLKFTVTDKAGHKTEKNMSYVMDRVAPVLYIGFTPDLVYTDSQYYLPEASVTITPDISNLELGNITYYYALNGATEWSESPTGVIVLPCSNNDVVQFQMYAVDEAGNQSNTFSRQFTVDTTAPSLAVTCSAVQGFSYVSGECVFDNAYTHTPFVFSVTASDNTSYKFYYTIDGTEYQNNSSSITVNSVPQNGQFTFSYRVVDPAGHEIASPTYTYKTDNVAPDINRDAYKVNGGNWALICYDGMYSGTEYCKSYEKKFLPVAQQPYSVDNYVLWRISCSGGVIKYPAGCATWLDINGKTYCEDSGEVQSSFDTTGCGSGSVEFLVMDLALNMSDSFIQPFVTVTTTPYSNGNVYINSSVHDIAAYDKLNQHYYPTGVIPSVISGYIEDAGGWYVMKTCFYVGNTPYCTTAETHDTAQNGTANFSVTLPTYDASKKYNRFTVNLVGPSGLEDVATGSVALLNDGLLWQDVVAPVLFTGTRTGNALPVVGTTTLSFVNSFACYSSAATPPAQHYFVFTVDSEQDIDNFAVLYEDSSCSDHRYCRVLPDGLTYRYKYSVTRDSVNKVIVIRSDTTPLSSKYRMVDSLGNYSEAHVFSENCSY